MLFLLQPPSNLLFLSHGIIFDYLQIKQKQIKYLTTSN